MKLFLIFFLSLSCFNVMAQKCIAHRGDNQNFLENSTAAFNSAAQMGAHGIEFDLHHTKDQVAILMHDKTLKRTAINAPGKVCPLETKIKDLTLTDIKENCLLSDGSAILSLEDMLYLMQDYQGHLFIELKDSPSLATLSLVNEFLSDEINSTYLISFKKRYLRKAYKLRNRFPIYKNMKMLNLNLWWPFAGKKLGINVSKLGKRFLFWARWWNKEIAIWTVDKASEMKKLFKKNVEFITTNNIATCLEVSRSRNL